MCERERGGAGGVKSVRERGGTVLLRLLLTSRTRCLIESISALHFAIVSSIVSRFARGFPNATRLSARSHINVRARSAWPMALMQWWIRPGPNRRCAISKPLPSPHRIDSCGTLHSVNSISMWPFGASSSPKTVRGRTRRIPGVSIGTSSIDCCLCIDGLSGSVLPMSIMIFV